MLGKIEGRGRRGQKRMRWLDGITEALVGDGQGSLVCCSPWGCKESDTTEQLKLVTSKKDLKRKNVPVIPPALFP